MLKVSTQNEYFISFAVNAVDGVKMGGGGGVLLKVTITSFSGSEIILKDQNDVYDENAISNEA